MDKSKLIKDITFYILIVFFFAIAVYAFVYIRSQSAACMNNPLQYGVAHTQASIGDFTCTCTSGYGKYVIITKDNSTESDYPYFAVSNKYLDITKNLLT